MFKSKTHILLIVMITCILFSVSAAWAQERASHGDANASASGWIAIASGLAISIAAFGGAISQSRAVSAALEGIARNPGAAGKMTTPMILGLALIETLVIYALLIAYFLQAKIH